MQRMLGQSPEFFFDVTAEAIAGGIERNSNHCVIAEAVKLARPHLTHIAVDIQTIRATDREKKERYVWLTPRSCQQFIIDFDSGKRDNLKPFKAKLRSGQAVEMYCRSDEEKKKRSKIRAKLRRPPRNTHNGPRAPLIPVGGKTPPRAVGQRRSFGLRSMVY